MNSKFYKKDIDIPVGTRWIDLSNKNVYARFDWGYKYLGKSRSNLPYVDEEIKESHEEDIYFCEGEPDF